MNNLHPSLCDHEVMVLRLRHEINRRRFFGLNSDDQKSALLSLSIDGLCESGLVIVDQPVNESVQAS